MWLTLIKSIEVWGLQLTISASHHEAVAKGRVTHDVAIVVQVVDNVGRFAGLEHVAERVEERCHSNQCTPQSPQALADVQPDTLHSKRACQCKSTLVIETRRLTVSFINLVFL